jgi:hypothetical protein
MQTIYCEFVYLIFEIKELTTIVHNRNIEIIVTITDSICNLIIYKILKYHRYFLLCSFLFGFLCPIVSIALNPTFVV